MKGTEDFFDEFTMEHLRFDLARLNRQTEMDTSAESGQGNRITFHSKVRHELTSLRIPAN